jgi:hypothetical protein
MPAASIKRVSPHHFSGTPMLDYRFFGASPQIRIRAFETHHGGAKAAPS